MNGSLVSPFNRLIGSDGEKMTTYANIFLIAKLMLVVMWSSTSPMKISGVGVLIISDTYQALDGIVIL